MKSLSQDGRCPDRGLNRALLECFSAALVLHQPAQIHQYRWKYKIKMDLIKINFDAVGWSHVAQG